MKTIEIAEVVHETIRAYKRVVGEDEPVDWAHSTKAVKDSNVAAVVAVLNNGGVTPEAQHKMWMTYMIGEGWLHGLEKDDQLKLHPNLIPYENLSLKDRTKDALVINTVKALIPMIDTL